MGGLAARELRRELHFLKAKNRELQRLVITDALTGVGNRRHFDAMLPAELQRAQRGRYQLALALVDVDRFKAINDHFGHGVGDGVLREIAQRLRKAARVGDLVFRYGGEEFVVLFAPAASPLQVAGLGQRMLAAVRASPIEPVNRVTVSVGLASFDGAALLSSGPEATWGPMRSVAADLVRRADAALYNAKRTGRDTACVG